METGQNTQAAPAIPVAHYLAAAKDVELRKLFRAQATAEGRAVRALEECKAAADAIAAYVATKYPAPDAPRAA